MKRMKNKIFSSLLIMAVFILACSDLKAANKTQQDKKLITESLKKNGKWYVFSSKKSTRFKVMGKYDYDHAKEGILYKGAQFKDKFYLMSEKGVVYEPTWETKNNLRQFVVPAEQYLKSLTKYVKKYKLANEMSSEKIKSYQDNVKELKGIWDDLVSDKLNNRRYSKYHNKYDRRINEAQKEYKKAKRELKKLLDKHEDISAKYKTADKKFKGFYSRYAADNDIAPERRELTEMIKKLPLEKVKHILQELKQAKETDKEAF